jgi:hypothetical protein
VDREQNVLIWMSRNVIGIESTPAQIGSSCACRDCGSATLRGWLASDHHSRP